MSGKEHTALEEQPLGQIPQRVLVLQQRGSAESKIKGIGTYGGGSFDLRVISIDEALPPILDDTSEFLPGEIEADLVLDFLRHQDLSHDLALMCWSKGIPVVASGKKIPVKGVITPPT